MTMVNIGQDSQLKEIGRNAFSGNYALMTIYIPSSVTAIANSFIADSSVSIINFNGTEEQWNAIKKADCGITEKRI